MKNRTIRRRLTAGALAAAALAGVAVTAGATPAAAATKCNTSSRSLDTPNYSGPWADNWDITVKNCAYRLNGTVYAKTSVTWDGPTYGTTTSDAFNSVRVRVYIKDNVSGADTVKNYKTYGITSRMSDCSSGSCDGSFSTGWISKYSPGNALYGDGALKIDWADDGVGTKHYSFTGSGLV